MPNASDPIRAAIARYESARAAVTRADAEVDRVRGVLAKLRTDLERFEQVAATVADDVGRAMVAELLDGAKPARSTAGGSLLSASTDVQQQRAAVAAAEQRHAAAVATAASARADTVASVDAVCEAEAHAAAAALFAAWGPYRAAWVRYAAAMDAAGHYVSPISESLFGVDDVEVQPVGQVGAADIEAAAVALQGPRLRARLLGAIDDRGA